MRYRLRTLLIMLTVGPVVLAHLWLAGSPSSISPAMALAVAVGVSLYTLMGFALFIAAVRLLEMIAESLGEKRR